MGDDRLSASSRLFGSFGLFGCFGCFGAFGVLTTRPGFRQRYPIGTPGLTQISGYSANSVYYRHVGTIIRSARHNGRRRPATRRTARPDRAGQGGLGYCDAFVIGFEQREDAQPVLEVLGTRQMNCANWQHLALGCALANVHSASRLAHILSQSPDRHGWVTAWRHSTARAHFGLTALPCGPSAPASTGYRPATALPSSTFADDAVLLLWSARNLDLDGLRTSNPPAPRAGATARAFGPASPHTWR